MNTNQENAFQSWYRASKYCQVVENWWLEWMASGKQPFIGAPWAIFATRMTLESVNGKT